MFDVLIELLGVEALVLRRAALLENTVKLTQ